MRRYNYKLLYAFYIRHFSFNSREFGKENIKNRHEMNYFQISEIQITWARFSKDVIKYLLDEFHADVITIEIVFIKVMCMFNIQITYGKYSNSYSCGHKDFGQIKISGFCVYKYTNALV